MLNKIQKYPNNEELAKLINERYERARSIDDITIKKDNKRYDIEDLMSKGGFVKQSDGSWYKPKRPLPPEIPEEDKNIMYIGGSGLSYLILLIPLAIFIVLNWG